MAGYGQSSTSPGNFTVDLGGLNDDQPPPYSQGYGQAGKLNQDEFQFVQGSSLSGKLISVKWKYFEKKKQQSLTVVKII